MRLFGKPSAPKLPLDLVSRMERFGKWEIDPVRSRDDGPAVFQETQQPLIELSRSDPAGFIRVLAGACLPVDGWAAYGAERTVVNLIGTDSTEPEWLALLDASIAFLRLNFVPPIRVAQYAWLRFIDTGGTSNTWLQLRPVPDRASVAITPLSVGELRRLLIMGPESNANVVLLTHGGHDDFITLIDARQSDEDPTRVRWEHKRADTLYDLYLEVASSCQVWEWAEPELEPFFPAPKARI